MKRLLVLVLLATAFTACAYDPVTGEWNAVPVHWTKPDFSDTDSTNDSLQRHMDTESYAREHNGRLPPPDKIVYP